jgi:hypothetical protein
LLASVESLPPDAVGLLQYGQSGTVLVESRAVCWAFASGMRRRLSTLLRQQRSPPLEASYIEELIEDCRRSGRPLGEVLLATGHISQEGLRTALFSHVVEAVARIAQSGADCVGFSPHERASYDPRFTFSTAEVLAALGEEPLLLVPHGSAAEQGPDAQAQGQDEQADAREGADHAHHGHAAVGAAHGGHPPSGRGVPLVVELGAHRGGHWRTEYCR